MASPVSRISSFTITQPFLGAPLQFQPALGSQELEELIDAWVVGNASKQDKLAEVTIDFYNRATVDITNGALVRRYDVLRSSYASGQSPTQSQSSGFSPSIYTPSLYTASPSSSVALGDSGRISTSRSSPGRPRAARVSKKSAKKDLKKAEFRLPGFSIMTKDGVDVTNSASRGTKSKEQREHAHLMRIMKACEDCKKKKVRCDPSHRRSSHAGSVSTPTTKSSSPPHLNGSPGSSSPSSSLEITRASTPNDFILFPEDTSSWDQTDMLSSDFDFDSQAFDLNNFDFDVNGMDLNDFSAFNEADSFDFFNVPNFPIERPSANASFVTNRHSPELAQWDSFSPSTSANPYSELAQAAGPPGSSLNSRDVDLPDRPRPGWTIDRSRSDLVELDPPAFPSGPSERAIASVPSSSSYANSLEWASSLYWAQPGSPASPTQAPSPEAVRSMTSNRRRRGSMSLHDGAIGAAANRANFGSFTSSPDEHLLQPGAPGNHPGHQDVRLKYDHAPSFSVEDLYPAAPSPRALVSQLQLSATGLETRSQARTASGTQDTSLNSEDRLRRRLSQQVSARRLDRSLCATVTTLETLDGEPSTATSNTRVLTSQHNRQLLVSLADVHPRGILRPTAISQSPATTLSLPGLAEAGALPWTISTMGRKRRGLYRSEAGQLETAEGLLSVILLASTIAASLVVFPMVVQLAAQFFKLAMVTGTTCVGTDPLAVTVELPAASFNLLRTAGIAPYTLLAVAASLLPLSIGSSGSLVSSTKHTLSKHFRKSEGSHWFGMLKRLSIGSSGL